MRIRRNPLGRTTREFAVDPVAEIIEAIRSLLMGTPMGDAAWVAMAWCAGILVASFVWGAWLFRRKVS